VTVRVGVGYDSHRFGPGGKPLVVAGTRVSAEPIVHAHSDGDVVAHAVTDAILGAAAVGDIGGLFPDTDAANRDRDSIEMLALAAGRVRAAGWEIGNVDVTVVCERYRIAPHRERMRSRLGAALRLDPGAIFVKGKTNEAMGWIGRGEGIACVAVASLVRSTPAT
jgi:2-C-methyl-D-erythritol 2,4-cyclodiphosphate synthase